MVKFYRNPVCRAGVGLAALLSARELAVAGSVAAPAFDTGSFVSITHDAGHSNTNGTEPAGSPYTYSGNSSFFGNGSASLTGPFNPHTINFPSGSSTGSTNAYAGIGHSESLTQAKVIFPGGLGCTQTDPRGTQGASAMSFTFNAKWDVPAGTQFGPPLAASFSIPIGATVGTGGSAEFICNIHWDLIVNGVTYTDARPGYSVDQKYSAGTYLNNFTAAAASFNPNLVANIGTGTYQFVERGNLSFYADNEKSPTAIGIPTFQQLFPNCTCLDQNNEGDHTFNREGEDGGDGEGEGNDNGKCTYTYTDVATGKHHTIDPQEFQQQFGYQPNASITFTSTQATSTPLPSSAWAGLVLLGGFGIFRFFKSKWLSR